jgi:YesN/AraC family two-component response regulator
VSVSRPQALIADDEPLLRDALERLLEQAWPQLEVVARARNGREAIDLFEAHRPHVCFLDVQMPGKTGIEAASHIGRRAHLVFVTAFDEYALEAFAHGVLDYLVKPVEPKRLAETVARLQARLRAAEPAHTEALLAQLAANFGKRSEPSRYAGCAPRSARPSI